MTDPKLKVDKKKVDTKEFELPETVFIRDIEDKVFESIVLQCLAKMDGIELSEGNYIDHLFRRSSEGITGIHAEQEEKNQSVHIKVEVSILYGISIPEKAEEIQSTITEEITKLTGLHVSSVHVVFKNVISEEQVKKQREHSSPQLINSNLEEEYPDEF